MVRPTAWAARPSPRPVKPMASVVVALTLTRVQRQGQQLRPAARASPGRCGFTLGRSQIRVTSTLTSRPPRARQPLDCVDQEAVSEDAPFHWGSVWRKWSPMSPVAHGPKNGVGQGVQARVGVGMADQGLVMAISIAAQPD